MQPTTTSRSILMYGLIGVALLGAILLGVQFAKNRSAQVASDGQQPTVAQETQQEQQPAAQGQEPTNPEPQPNTQEPAQDQQPTPQTTPNTGALGTSTENGSIKVPATGTGDIALSVVGVGLLAFSAVVYVRSRRQLAVI